MENKLRLRLSPRPWIFGLIAGTSLGLTPAIHAELAPPMGLGFVVRDELTKAVIGFIVESVLKNGQFIPSLRTSLLPSSKPSLHLSVEITEYLRNTRLKYPRQPLLTEDYSVKLISSGYLVTRNRRVDGVAMPLDSLVLPFRPGGLTTANASANLPPWWIPPQLNHLKRSCGAAINGDVVINDSDETFQLGVRAEGSNWNVAAGSVVSTSVRVMLDHLQNTCMSALETLPDGTLNGRLVTALVAPVVIQLDSKGNGSSAPIRMGDPRVFVETAGSPPVVWNPVVLQVTQSPVDR